MSGASPKPRRVPVALQLWSIREEVARDFTGAVHAVAKMGYQGVELAGYGNTDAKGARAALDAAGLKAAGMHVSYASIAGDLNPVLLDALTLGTNFVTCSWWPPTLVTSRSVCERIGEQLNGIGATFRANGIRFGFHNHDSEFRIFDGKPGFEWILGAAEPRNLFGEFDVYWARFAGYAPDRFLLEQGKRLPLLHLKDSKELGSGPVDFGALFAADDAVRAAEWYIVEQEQYSHAPIESVRLCLETMRSWGRA